MSDNDIVQDFLVESSENLDRLDRDLVGLEKNPRDKDALAGVFRTIHTIKGTCGFLGFTKLEKVVHVGENLLTRLRDGHLMLNPEITTALLSMVDAVRQMLKEIQLTGSDGKLDYPELRETLTRLQNSSGSATGTGKASKKSAQHSAREAGPADGTVPVSSESEVKAKLVSPKAEGSTAQCHVEAAPAAVAPKQETANAVEQSEPAPIRVEEVVAAAPDPAKPESAGPQPGSESKPRDAVPETIRVGVNLLDKLMTWSAS
jgi:two-component system, chemotaxis family, sensor kinase CheA